MTNTNNNPENKLTDQELAALNCFVYYVKDIEQPIENLTLGELVSIMKSDPDWLDERYDSLMATKEETEAMMDYIANNDKLADMVIKDNTYNDGGRALNMCLVDEKNKNAVMLFRGTAAKEWYDNAEAFVEEESDAQKDAAEFVENAIENNNLDEEYTVIATGHSKGGNKAMYSTITLPGVIDRCVSFDGQGFSNEFVDKYPEEIANAQEKIVAYASNKDIVNALGNTLSGQQIYLDGKVYGNLNNLSKKISEIGDKFGIESAEKVAELVNGLINHSPFAYVNFDNGTVNFEKEAEQSELAKTVQDQSVKMMDLPKEEKLDIFQSVMQLVVYLNGNEEQDSNLPKQSLGDTVKGIGKMIDFMGNDENEKDKNEKDGFVKNQIKTVTNYLIENAKDIKDTFKSIRDDIKEGIDKVTGAGKEVIGAILKGGKDILNAGKETVQEVGKDILDGAKDIVNNGGEALKNTLDNLSDSLKKVFDVEDEKANDKGNISSMEAYKRAISEFKERNNESIKTPEKYLRNNSEIAK